VAALTVATLFLPALQVSWRIVNRRTPDGDSSYEFFKPPTDSISNITTVVINEVLAHSHGADPDWIELHNVTDFSIDIGGWFLSDNFANRTKYEIAVGTSMPPGGYAVFYEDTDFGDPCDPACHVPFALSENGEMVCLSSGSGGVLTGYYKKQDFGASQTGVSLGCYKKSTGLYDFVAMDSTTPDGANAYPRVGPIIINEIMYHPSTVEDAEYIELYNTTGAVVNLYDAEANPWKFTDGIDFTFPPATSISAYTYLLVVKDPTTFTSIYSSMPPGVQVLGPYDGRLDNAGEQVQISMPGDIDAGGQLQYICVDNIYYNNNSPWPTGTGSLNPDGGGASLSRLFAQYYGNDPNNWRAASPSPGTSNP